MFPYCYHGIPITWVSELCKALLVRNNSQFTINFPSLPLLPFQYLLLPYPCRQFVQMKDGETCTLLGHLIRFLVFAPNSIPSAFLFLSFPDVHRTLLLSLFCPFNPSIPTLPTLLALPLQTKHFSIILFLSSSPASSISSLHFLSS